MAKVDSSLQFFPRLLPGPMPSPDRISLRRALWSFIEATESLSPRRLSIPTDILEPGTEFLCGRPIAFVGFRRELWGAGQSHEQGKQKQGGLLSQPFSTISFMLSSFDQSLSTDPAPLHCSSRNLFHPALLQCSVHARRLITLLNESLSLENKLNVDREGFKPSLLLENE